MGLNEEVAAANETAGAIATGEQPPLIAEVSRDLNLPGEEIPPGEGAEAAPAEEAKIIIGDQSFATKEEAWAYAESLQSKVNTDEQANDMYRQGIKDAMLGQKPGDNVTPEPAPEENFEEEFYADPQAFLKKMQAKSTEDAAKLAQKMFDERDSASAKAQETKALWDQFYSENGELASKDLVVKAILQRDWQSYENLQPKAAMVKLAAAARAELRSYSEADKPRTELTNQRDSVSIGGGENVTRSAPEEKAMDFISQINKIQDKGITS